MCPASARRNRGPCTRSPRRGTGRGWHARSTWTATATRTFSSLRGATIRSLGGKNDGVVNAPLVALCAREFPRRVSAPPPPSVGTTDRTTLTRSTREPARSSLATTDGVPSTPSTRRDPLLNIGMGLVEGERTTITPPSPPKKRNHFRRRAGKMTARANPLRRTSSRPPRTGLGAASRTTSTATERWTSRAARTGTTA